MQTKASLLKITATCVALFGLATANAQLVFEASTLGSGGSSVNSWADSALTPTVTLTPTGTAPLVQLQGTTKYVDFNDTDLAAAGVSDSIIGTSQNAVFMVFRNPSGSASLGATALIWINGTDTSKILNLAETTGFGPSSTIAYVHGGLNVDQLSVPTPAAWNDGNWHVLTAVRNGTSGQIRIDGVPVTPATGAFPNSVTTGGTGTLFVGGSPWGAGDDFIGDIAEIQIHSTVPSDINLIELGFNTKYSELGLTVVPEPSEYAMIFGLACVAGALALRYRRQQLAS